MKIGFENEEIQNALDEVKATREAFFKAMCKLKYLLEEEADELTLVRKKE